mmetsp:Transcript_33758/g.61177  ORF Transcript_33758/g.61177 Transcript_33758/m.61177 type:complete len:789 (+) Transcript_33758:51-2417(+)
MEPPQPWLRQLQIELGGCFTLVYDESGDVFSINNEIFTIQSLLGEGSYGSVYKCNAESADQPGTVRQFAVKIVSTDRIAMISNLPREAVVRRMLREAEILGCVGGHPHIVQPHCAAVSPSSLRIFIVMQLIQCNDLFTEMLRRRQALSELDARTVITQLAMAVTHCHRRQVAHRDIKLENVMLDCIHPLSVKLIDFGQAKMTHEMATDNEQIQIHQTAKTLTTTMIYTPPDVRQAVQENSAYDAFKLDSFGIGIVSYALLCSYLPDTAQGGQNYMQNPRWSKLSLEAQDFVQQLLCLDPKQRLAAHDILKHQWLLQTWSTVSAHSKVSTPGDHETELQALLTAQSLNKALQRERGASCWMLSGSPEAEVQCRWLCQDTDEQLGKTFDALNSIGFENMRKLQMVKETIAACRNIVRNYVMSGNGMRNFDTIFGAYNDLNEEVIDIIGELLVSMRGGENSNVNCAEVRIRMLLMISEQLGRERGFISGHIGIPENMKSMSVQIRFAKIRGCREFLLGSSQHQKQREILSSQRGLLCELRLVNEPLLSKEDLEVIEAAENTVFQAGAATSEWFALITTLIDKVHQHTSIAIVKFIQELVENEHTSPGWQKSPASVEHQNSHLNLEDASSRQVSADASASGSSISHQFRQVVQSSNMSSAEMQTYVQASLAEIQEAQKEMSREPTPMKVLPSTWTPTQFTPEATPLHPGLFRTSMAACMLPSHFEAPPPVSRAPTEQRERAVVMSKGTVGHPYSCKGLGCKFAAKERGCKEGVECLRCHLCPWRRAPEKATR